MTNKHIEKIFPPKRLQKLGFNPDYRVGKRRFETFEEAEKHLKKRIGKLRV